MSNGGIAKIIFYILLIFIILEIIYGIYQIYDLKRPLKVDLCNQAYACEVDKENSNILNCKYINEENKETNIKCNNSNWSEVNE